MLIFSPKTLIETIFLWVQPMNLRVRSDNETRSSISCEHLRQGKYCKDSIVIYIKRIGYKIFFILIYLTEKVNINKMENYGLKL